MVGAAQKRRRKPLPSYVKDRWPTWRHYEASKRGDLDLALIYLKNFQQGCAWLGRDSYAKFKAAEQAMKELRQTVTLKALKNRG